MEPWFIFAIAAVVLWGFSAVFAKLGTSRLGVGRVALLIVVVEGVMYSVGFYYWRENIPIGFQDAALAAICCVSGTVAYLCYFESILDGQVSIVGTISAAYPALAVLGALVVLSETLTTTQALGVVSIIGGVVGLSYEQNPQSSHAMPKRSLIFALLALGFWSFWSLTAKIAIGRIGPGNLLGFYVVSASIVPLTYMLIRKFRREELRGGDPSLSSWSLGTTCLVLNVAGTYACMFAFYKGPAALVVPVSSAYPLVTIALALAFLHERLTRLHTIAVGAVIIGLMMIGMTA